MNEENQEMIEDPVYQEPSKEISIGNVSITLCNELIQIIKDQLQMTFESDSGMDELLSAFTAGEEIAYGEDKYTGYIVVKKFGFEINNEDRRIYQITLEKEPEKPLSEDDQFAIDFAKSNMSDDDALAHPSLFDNWEDIPEGTTIEKDTRLNYNGGLWKCAKTHKKQASWYPGAEATLFEQLDKDEHGGSKEDPIPVPSSVTTSGFTYVVGNYYSENGTTYLCKRQGMSDGQEIKLFYGPSALLNQYFVTA